MLTAVLGETPKLTGALISIQMSSYVLIFEGFIRVVGSVTYVPQQAWIQHATVKENILFGRPFDAKRYARTIKVLVRNKTCMSNVE